MNATKAPVTWEEFRKCPIEHQREILVNQRNERGISYKIVAAEYGTTPKAVKCYVREHRPELREIISSVGVEVPCEGGCGRTIIKRTAVHTRCLECAEKVNRQKAAERRKIYGERTRANKKAKEAKENEAKAAAREKPTLAEVNEAARKNNMSYGQYVCAWKAGKVEPPCKFPPKRRKRGLKKP